MSGDRGLAVVFAVIAALVLPTCGGEISGWRTDQTICQDGVTYWLDNFGSILEVKEHCRCGCKADRSECRLCDCTCSVVDYCCDGCMPVNQGGPCNDDDPGTRLDTCHDGVCLGLSFEIEPPAPPADPEPVQLRSWTCPAGWSPLEHGTQLDENGDPFSWCQPPALPRIKLGDYITPLREGELEGDRPVCEPEVDGTYPVLGQAACQPLGEPCPAGEWPEVPAGEPGNRIYVKAGAAGGDGTQAAPFGAINDAVAAAATGDVVVIAAGVYTRPVTISKQLTLWGKCVQQTVIDATPVLYGSAVRVTGAAEVSIRNLRISSTQRGVSVDSESAAVSLRGVWIHRATFESILVSRGGVELLGVLVDSTLPDNGGLGGLGIFALDGAQVRAEYATFERNRDLGLQLIGNGTRVELVNAAVRDTQSRVSDSRSGRGMEVTQGAEVVCDRVLLERNRVVGILASDAGTTLELTDVTVRDTQSRESDQWFGAGLEAHRGARVTISRGRFERNRFKGLQFTGAGTTVEMTDVLVRDTRCLEYNRQAGFGLGADSGARLTLRRGLFDGNRMVGLMFASQATTVWLEDLSVLNTRSQESDGLHGQGLWAGLGAQVTVSRGLFAGNRLVGILAEDEGTTVDLRDVIVRDTLSQEADLDVGWGLNAQNGARLLLARGLFERNRDIGIAAFHRGTTLELADVVVRETLSREVDDEGGRGLNVQEGAQATVRRGRFEENREIGIFAALEGTMVDLEDVVVSRTKARKSDLGVGRGLNVQSGAGAKVCRGLFEQNRDVGILATGAGTNVSLENVTVLDTQSEENTLTSGQGLQANFGAQAAVSRGRFEGNRELGVSAFHAGTTLTLQQVSIRGTRKRGCASLPADDIRICAGNGAGTGLGAYERAVVSATDVELADSALAGLQLSRLASAVGQGLEIRGNPIGVNIQEVPAGYDFFEEVVGLRMEDNQVNFDSRELPVPDPLEDVSE